MRTQRDQQRPRPGAPRPATTPTEVSDQAQKAQAAGRFREAIELFKAWARGEPDGKWREGMADAYRGRALELEAKGMLKEALTIWDNRDQACPGLVPDPRHLSLLLRLGRLAPALARYRRLRDGGESPGLIEVRGRCAAWLVTADLPPDLAQATDLTEDPLIRDYPAAHSALLAYSAGADAEASAWLKAIPFRSPYRDLATLLKALLGLSDNPAASRSLVERVGEDSPFAPLVQALLLALQPSADLVPLLGGVSEPVRDFVMTLRGWPEPRRQLWKELDRLGPTPDILQWTTLLHRYRSRLGESWLRHRARALAINSYPRKLPSQLQRELSPFDQDMAIAILGEEEGTPAEARALWHKAIHHFTAAGKTPAPGSEDALRLALIYRRIAGNLKKFSGSLRRWAEEGLATSLDLDPDYLPGYLQLIGHYRHDSRPREARAILDRALRRWPEDAEVLNEALNLALASDAFKKAASLAKRILDRDPINRRAKQSLFRAHLAHARKQVIRSRLDLAHKELEQASGWAEGAASLAQVELVRGIIAWRQAGDCRATLVQACATLGGGLRGPLALALEAERLRFSPTTLLKQASLLPLPAADRDELLAYCRALRLLAEEDDFKPRTTWRTFHATLRQAARLPLEQADFETVLESLRLVGLAELRLDFANAALKRWPRRPFFLVHQYEAKLALGKPGYGAWDAMAHLEDALIRARAEGDHRTVHRIEELLGLYSPLDTFDDYDALLDDDDFDDYAGGDGLAEADAEGDLSDLLAHLDPQVFVTMLKDILGPEYKKLERELGKDVIGGMKRLIREGDAPDMPPDLVKFLMNLPDANAGTRPGPPAPLPSSPRPRPAPQPRPRPRSGPKAAAGPAEKPATETDDPKPNGQLELF